LVQRECGRQSFLCSLSAMEQNIEYGIPEAKRRHPGAVWAWMGYGDLDNLRMGLYCNVLKAPY
jgi:hypothetical protein